MGAWSDLMVDENKDGSGRSNGTCFVAFEKKASGEREEGLGLFAFQCLPLHLSFSLSL